MKGFLWILCIIFAVAAVGAAVSGAILGFIFCGFVAYFFGVLAGKIAQE